MPNPIAEKWGSIKDAAGKAKDVVAHPIDSATEAVSSSASGKLIDILTDLSRSAGESVLKWLKWFILEPGIYDNPTVDTVLSFFKWFAIALLPCLMLYHILEGMVRVNVDGDRIYMKEKLVAMMKAMVLIAILPWIIDMLLKLSKYMSLFFINKGIVFEDSAIGKWLTAGKPSSELAKVIGLNLESGLLFVAIASVVFVVIFLIIAFQTVKVIGEFTFLVATSPIAAISLVSSDMNAFPVWWREMVAVVFTRVLQHIILFMVVNLFASMERVQIVIAFGLLLVLISGPTYLRQFLYSSGSGKAAIGAMGSMGKVAVGKYILRGGR